MPVPDERLAVLSKASGSQKVIAATVEFVDIAGHVKGASKGEGLGNKFRTHIRECDSLVPVWGGESRGRGGGGVAAAAEGRGGEAERLRAAGATWRRPGNRAAGDTLL